MINTMNIPKKKKYLDDRRQAIVDDVAKDSFQSMGYMLNVPLVPINIDIKQEEENSMAYNNEKNYLNNLLNEKWHDKRNELAKQFNINGRTEPRNFREMLDWVKTDKFTIDAKIAKIIDHRIDEDECVHYPVTYGITWNALPARDIDGFSKASNELDKQRERIAARIQVWEPKDALTEVESLDTWAYSATA